LEGWQSPRVRSGQVVALRLFDVAYAVDLGRAEAIWKARPSGGTARGRLQATPPKAVAYDVPPLVLSLEPVTIELPGGPVTASASARLYEFGVLTLALDVPARDLDWEAFSDLLNQVNLALASGDAAGLWQRLSGEVVALLAEALERPAPSALEEDYIIGLVRAFDRPVTAAEIGGQAGGVQAGGLQAGGLQGGGLQGASGLDLVPLLSGERMALSEGARQDLLRNRFSYYTDDLVALTWDRAFIYEPRGDSDVLDVLEVANAQLLEMRYYDELLDDELPRMYDLVESTRRASGLLSSRRFSVLARRLYTLVAEVTELTEKADNALQVTEDVYLARIYSAALELFRVRLVSGAVDRKLAIIRDTYAALYEEASSGRAALMELAIVVLIVMEVVLALVRH